MADVAEAPGVERAGGGVAPARLGGGAQARRSYAGLRSPPVAWATESCLAERSLATYWGRGGRTGFAHRDDIALACSENVGSDDDRCRPSAVPDASNAIRYQFDEDEPPALVFNDQASPGALVSWAWTQLQALDALLTVMIERGSRDEGVPDLAGAVRTVLVPVINALAFSEQRANVLQEAPPASRGHQRKGDAAARKKRKTAR